MCELTSEAVAAVLIGGRVAKIEAIQFAVLIYFPIHKIAKSSSVKKRIYNRSKRHIRIMIRKMCGGEKERVHANTCAVSENAIVGKQISRLNKRICSRSERYIGIMICNTCDV